MFKKLSIKTRLIAVMAFLSVELIVGALMGLGGLWRANGSMESMYQDRVVTLKQLDLVIRLLNRNKDRIMMAVSGTPAQTEAYLDEVEANRKTIDQTWTAYRKHRISAQEAQLADAFERDRVAFVDGALAPAVRALRAGDTATATAIVHGALEARFTPLRADANNLINLQLDAAHAAFEASQTEYLMVRIVCLGGLAFGLAMAAASTVVLLRAISRPLDAAVEAAEQIATGNLAHPVKVTSEDEMGSLMRALQHMQESLGQIVTRVRAGTETIATASSQIASGNLDLSSRTESQASSLEQTAASMEELTTTVKQNADNARHANATAQTASALAHQGGAVVGEVVATMESINASANKIVDIIGVIDGIAFQTNILALNAAVEAARAGEQGRGFAVVAAEVRTLAQRSAAAAKEIKGLIDDSVGRVENGSRLAHQAGATMSQVVGEVQRVADLMGEISAASVAQTEGIEQVNAAIGHMDDATQQNAALVEEAAAAAQSLQGQADELTQVVGVFKLAAAGPQAARPAPGRTARPAIARGEPRLAAPVG